MSEDFDPNRASFKIVESSVKRFTDSLDSKVVSWSSKRVPQKPYVLIQNTDVKQTRKHVMPLLREMWFQTTSENGSEKVYTPKFTD